MDSRLGCGLEKGDPMTCEHPGRAARRPRDTRTFSAMFAAVYLVSIFLSGTSGCVKRPGCRPGEDKEAGMRMLYQRAIADAALFRAENVRVLPRITANEVSVVTWTDAKYTRGEARLAKPVWVTLAPVVRDLCRQWSDGTEARLEQLLGLPPENGYTHFVEMTVRAEDIWRPCPDPDISTERCGNQFPEKLDPVYLAWYARTLVSSYRLPDGYPFTGLGYTYDWNPETPRFGPAELVVGEGALVRITRVVSTREYCKP